MIIIMIMKIIKIILMIMINNNWHWQECINQRLMLMESTYPKKKEVEVVSNWKLDSNVHYRVRYLPSGDPMLAMIREHDLKKKLYSIRKKAETYRKELDVLDLKFAENESVTASAKRAKTNVKQQGQVKTAQKRKRDHCVQSTPLASKRQMWIAA